MKLALGNMQLFYGHAYTMVLKSTALPPPPEPLAAGKWYRSTPDPATGATQELGWCVLAY